MKIYLAAPWACREEARRVREVFVEAGFTLVSRWLDVDETKTTQTEEARNDIRDLLQANALVVLNLRISEGKAWEQGFAHACGLPIVYVGEPSNVFQHLTSLDGVFAADSISAAITQLRSITPELLA